MQRPTLLIMSFSRIAADARLLKQIRAFAGEYRVTTCGYGPQPFEGVEHLELDDTLSKRVKQAQGVALQGQCHGHQALEIARRRLSD